MSRGDFGSQKYGEYGAVSSQESGKVEFGFATSDTAYQSFEAYRDFDERCQKVSSSVQVISTKTTQIEKLLKKVGTESDESGLRQRLGSLRVEIQHTIGETTGLLKQLERDVRTGSSGIKKNDSVRFDRLKSDYYKCAKRYQKALKGVLEAERIALPAHGRFYDRGFSGGGGGEGAYSDETAGLVNADAEERRELEHLQRQEQIIDFHQTELEEREEGIKKIESEILQCNEIFKDLGVMVHEQGSQIDLIEANITTTKGRVEEGTQQLRRAKEYQKKARKKMCCLAIVIIIIAAVLAIIIYFSVRKK